MCNRYYETPSTYSLFICVQGNDAFSRKFENGVDLTAMNTEHPGRSMNNKQVKSQYRQGGFLTVII